MSQKRWYWRWRQALFALLLIFICWTFTAYPADCKPISENSQHHDQWPKNGDDTDRVPLLSSSEAITRIDELRQSMENFKQLRLMLNDRLLASKNEEQSTKEDEDFVLVAAVDESGDSSDHRFVLKRADDPENEQNRPPKPRHRTHRAERQQRKHRQKMRSLTRHQRKHDDASGVDADSDWERPMQDDAYRNQINAGQRKSSSDSMDAIRQRQGEPRRVLATFRKPDNECPKVHGKATQVLCPSRRRHGYRVCIPDTALCNGYADCPNGEDEDPVNCLFYKTTIHHFRLIVDAVVELSDMVKRHETIHSMDEL